MNNKVIKIFAMVMGATAIFCLNYFFIESIIIPDPCYYHTRDTGFLFDLFYSIPPASGGHPIPSILNLIFTIAAGLFIGWKAYKFFISRHKATISNNSTM